MPVERLQGDADAALAEVEALKLQARLEDLNVWQIKRSSRAARAARHTPTEWLPGAMATGRTIPTWRAPGRWMARRQGGACDGMHFISP